MTESEYQAELERAAIQARVVGRWCYVVGLAFGAATVIILEHFLP